MENHILKVMQKYVLILPGLKKKKSKRENSVTQLKPLVVCLTMLKTACCFLEIAGEINVTGLWTEKKYRFKSS